MSVSSANRVETRKELEKVEPYEPYELKNRTLRTMKSLQRLFFFMRIISHRVDMIDKVNSTFT